MDDTQIIELFFMRDEAAIEEIKRTYSSYCASVARNILDTEEDVEEVLNDTWLRVWNAIPPERPSHLKLYLARISRNLAFDKFRTQRTQKRNCCTILALDELAECVSSGQSPENTVQTEELKQAINRFLAQLPIRDRQVFLLRYFYVEDTQSIAGWLHIRPDLVRTILSRTRKKLKTYLVKEGFING